MRVHNAHRLYSQRYICLPRVCNSRSQHSNKTITRQHTYIYIYIHIYIYIYVHIFFLAAYHHTPHLVRVASPNAPKRTRQSKRMFAHHSSASRLHFAVDHDIECGITFSWKWVVSSPCWCLFLCLVGFWFLSGEKAPAGGWWQPALDVAGTRRRFG